MKSSTHRRLYEWQHCLAFSRHWPSKLSGIHYSGASSSHCLWVWRNQDSTDRSSAAPDSDSSRSRSAGLCSRPSARGRRHQLPSHRCNCPRSRYSSSTPPSDAPGSDASDAWPRDAPRGRLPIAAVCEMSWRCRGGVGGAAPCRRSASPAGPSGSGSSSSTWRRGSWSAALNGEETVIQDSGEIIVWFDGLGRWCSREGSRWKIGIGFVERNSGVWTLTCGICSILI